MKTNTKQDIILFEEMASNAHVALNIVVVQGTDTTNTYGSGS